MALRILLMHSRYLSGVMSGENRVVEDEATLLREAGHSVHVIAPSPNDLGRAALASRALFSLHVTGVVRDAIRSREIDIVHCHNLFPALGLGVLSAAVDANAALVVTLHNYRYLCLAGTFRRRGQPCEVCLGRPPWRGVVHRCYRGSALESAVLASALIEHRRRGVFDRVHRFLAVSEYVRSKYVQAGFPADRIVVKPNFVRSHLRRTGPGSYFLVLGRLSEEKGVAGLARLWRPEFGQLRIVGDGPERDEVSRIASERGVLLLPPVEPEQIPSLLSQARALLLPSLSYEGQPRVVLEAYSAGVPVVAHDVGALPEIVLDGETGLLVPVRNESGWRAAVRQLLDDGVSMRLGERAHQEWEDRFAPPMGLAALEAAYRGALEECG